MVIADDATLVQTLVQKKTLNDKKRLIVYFVLSKYSTFFLIGHKVFTGTFKSDLATRTYLNGILIQGHLVSTYPFVVILTPTCR